MDSGAFEFLVVMGAVVSESLLGVVVWGFSLFSSAVGIPFAFFVSWSFVLGFML